jgi:hypothetical protein
VATVQLHEASVDKKGNEQLSLLCNDNSSVDFGIGQVNTVSWGDLCKGMADGDIVRTATDICSKYRKNPNYYKQKYGKIINGKLQFNINSFIVETLVQSYKGEANLVRYEKSPFNPIVNSRCTYRHLESDFQTARRMFPDCRSLESVDRFRCSGDPTFDYAAVALMAYGGLRKQMLVNNVRLKSGGEVKQTFDDYMAEFRAAYSAIYKEPPPF